MTFETLSREQVENARPSDRQMQRSIVYGSIAVPIKKPESDHTHKWTIYVRGFHDEDISKIVFQDANQKPLNFTHHLMLYPTEEASQVKTSRPVISEHYEEIIFDPPTELMADILKQELQYVDPKTSPRYAE
ncbi:hypothetical protein PSACC_01543, partial [Paramicrosporidium saccamoebae]